MESNGDGGGLRVLGDVGQRLLDDPVDDGLQLGGEARQVLQRCTPAVRGGE